MKDDLHKSKADYLLNGLTYKEAKKFNKFIINYLGGSGEHIYKYWEYRLSQMKLTGSFLSTGAKENFTRKIISDFVKILEKFYSLKGFEKDSLRENGYLISELRNRHLYKLFNSLLIETKQHHKSNVRKGYTNYLNLLSLNLEEYFLYNSRNDDLCMIQTSKNITSTSEIIYIQFKLIEYINQNLYCSENSTEMEELNSIANVTDYVKRNSDKFKNEHQGVYLLYLLYEMIEDFNDAEKTNEVLNFIMDNYNNLTINFLQLSYEIIIRFYIMQVNSGNSQSLSDLYNLLKEIEKKELFRNIQHIQPLSFLTAISVSLTFGDVDFAANFLNKYSIKINAEYKKQVSIIGEAMITLSKGSYSKTKNLLVNDKTKNISIYVFSKTTLLKTMYEMNDLIAMVPLIDTIKHYLNRHLDMKLPYKSSIFTFLNYLNTLSTVKRKNGRGAERLLDRLKDDKQFFQKRWIASKTKEFLSR